MLLRKNEFINTKIKEVEKKIRDDSGFMKKTDYNAKISDIETEYFTISEYNKFTGKILEAKIRKGLVDKSDIFGFIGHPDLEKKIGISNADLSREKQNNKITSVWFKLFLW